MIPLDRFCRAEKVRFYGEASPSFSGCKIQVVENVRALPLALQAACDDLERGPSLREPPCMMSCRLALLICVSLAGQHSLQDL